MKTSLKLLLLSTFALMVSACSKAIPPHVAVKCKVTYDVCMVKNAFKGPVASHRYCIAQRKGDCRYLPSGL